MLKHLTVEMWLCCVSHYVCLGHQGIIDQIAELNLFIYMKPVRQSTQINYIFPADMV